MKPVMLDTDELFFRQHPDRQALIRSAGADEQNAEFLSLGPHDRTRRRIICWRVPADVRAPFVSWRGKIVRIPFLAFADESIESSDAVLMPLIAGIMEQAAEHHGMKPAVV